MDARDIYSGNDFSIGTAGGEWTLWRICDDDGGREQIILTTQAMDELAAYFAECYSQDRKEALVTCPNCRGGGGHGWPGGACTVCGGLGQTTRERADEVRANARREKEAAAQREP